jgi:ubiquinone/menaquinone biosynthesis C-methylase UbiE
MNEIDPRLIELFFEVQRGLPRQGPGNQESTSNALALCSGLPEEPSVLDIGCGPGMQTVTLTEATSGNVVAVDNCDEYLDQLRRRLEQASLSDRVEVKNADMADMGFVAKTFDLIWSEGAAYIMGVREALKSWRPLLKDRGYLAFTELVWLEEQPPAEVAAFFGKEYPAMTRSGTIAAAILQSGYQPLGDFTLPDSAWWEDYYTPLEAKLPSLKQKYDGDEVALDVIAMAEAEIDMRRRFGQSYGYQFFVARKVE